MTDRLIELADRVEALDGPSREVDAEIASATDSWTGSTKGIMAHVAPFTASLDSAMELVPEGWRVRDFGDWEDRWEIALMNENDMAAARARGRRGQPACALTAAALRAISEDTSNDQ